MKQILISRQEQFLDKRKANPNKFSNGLTGKLPKKNEEERNKKHTENPGKKMNHQMNFKRILRESTSEIREN